MSTFAQKSLYLGTKYVNSYIEWYARIFSAVNPLSQVFTVTMFSVCVCVCVCARARAMFKKKYFPQNVTNNEVKHNFHKLAWCITLICSLYIFRIYRITPHVFKCPTESRKFHDLLHMLRKGSVHVVFVDHI